MSDIFMSYAREDYQQAEALAHVFETHSWSVWWDTVIPPGESFDEVIEKAIGTSRCLIVLWSTASVRSDWVKAEAAEGLRRGTLVPVLIEAVTIPLEFRRIQAANLCGWAPGVRSVMLDLLIQTVARHLNPPSEGFPLMEMTPRRRTHNTEDGVPQPLVKFRTPAWRASVVALDKTTRTLNVYLTRLVHRVQCDYQVRTWSDLLLIKVNNVVVAQKKVTVYEELISRRFEIDFVLNDDDDGYISRMEIRMPQFSTRITSCRLIVSTKELYTEGEF